MAKIDIEAGYMMVSLMIALALLLFAVLGFQHFYLSSIESKVVLRDGHLKSLCNYNVQALSQYRGFQKAQKVSRVNAGKLTEKCIRRASR